LGHVIWFINNFLYQFLLKLKQVEMIKKKHIGYLMIGVLLAAILYAGGSYAYWSVFDYRFTTVTEGRFYLSAEMPPTKLLEVVQKYKIRAVIDLRKPGEKVDAERAALVQVGIEHFHLPTGQVPPVEVVEKYLAILDQAENRPVLVHCRHGEGRSVLFMAIYRIEYEGWSNERARRASRLIPWIGSFKPSSRKGKFLREYVPRPRATHNLTFNSPIPQASM
jgi:protein-tyrosine phosphatase